MSNLIKTLPPLNEFSKLAGLNLPDYLGNVGENYDGKNEETTNPE